MLFVILLCSASCVFGKCIECKISCTGTGSTFDSIDDFYILGKSTKYSNKQTISQDKYDTVSSACKYCNVVHTIPCEQSSKQYSHTCTCSKRQESILGLEAIIDEEVETLLEEGAIASVGVLAVAALVPPPLPMFPPLGLPQPIALQDGITRAVFQGTIEAGVLPSTALTVNNSLIMHSLQN